MTYINPNQKFSCNVYNNDFKIKSSKESLSQLKVRERSVFGEIEEEKHSLANYSSNIY